MKQRQPSDAGLGTISHAGFVGASAATDGPLDAAALDAEMAQAAASDAALPTAAASDAAGLVGAPAATDGPLDAAALDAEMAQAAASDAAAHEADGSAWAGLLRAVDAAVVEPTWRHGEDDLVDRLRVYEAVRARLDAHRLALVRELDARGWAAAV